MTPTQVVVGVRIHQAGQLLAGGGRGDLGLEHPPLAGCRRRRRAPIGPGENLQGRTFAQRRDTAVIAVLKASGIRAGELAGIRYDAHDASRSDLDLCQREITVRGKGGGSRIVRTGHEPAQALDRYIRIRSKHAPADHDAVRPGSQEP